MTVATFFLLDLGICSAWMGPARAGHRRFHVWLALLVAATVSGLVAKVLTWPAVPALLILVALASQAADHQTPAGRRSACLAGVLLLSLALALHALPGFHNLLLLDQVRITADAAPFTLYANVDKGALGLVLLALLCRKSAGAAEWRATLLVSLPIAAATIVVVLGAGVAIGQVGVEPKWFAHAPLFLLVNLFLTCVAEEAFFRGVIQEHIAARCSNGRYATAVPVVTSAVLFGLAHASGGPRLVLLGTLAGLGYALAYQSTRRIEAPILVHFALNAVHFTCFTYPFIG